MTGTSVLKSRPHHDGTERYPHILQYLVTLVSYRSKLHVSHYSTTSHTAPAASRSAHRPGPAQRPQLGKQRRTGAVPERHFRLLSAAVAAAGLRRPRAGSPGGPGTRTASTEPETVRDSTHRAGVARRETRTGSRYADTPFPGVWREIYPITGHSRRPRPVTVTFGI